MPFKTKTVIRWSILTAFPVFALMLFYTIKTKSSDISHYAPFNEWAAQTVTLHTTAVLFEDSDPLNEQYPYILYDSLHPDWQFTEERKHADIYSLKEIKVFPAATKFRIEKAIIYTNGVSGFSTPLLVGTISDGQTIYPVNYKWGTYNFGRAFDNIKECWSFHQAPWQLQKDTAFYYLPKGKW